MANGHAGIERFIERNIPGGEPNITFRDDTEGYIVISDQGQRSTEYIIRGNGEIKATRSVTNFFGKNKGHVVLRDGELVSEYNINGRSIRYGHEGPETDPSREFSIGIRNELVEASYLASDGSLSSIRLFNRKLTLGFANPIRARENLGDYVVAESPSTQGAVYPNFGQTFTTEQYSGLAKQDKNKLTTATISDSHGLIISTELLVPTYEVIEDQILRPGLESLQFLMTNPFMAIRMSYGRPNQPANE